MSVDFAKSKTAVNLMRSFAGESQARNRYTMAGDALKKKGYFFLYNIFRITADQEKAHAKVFYDHLKVLSGRNIIIPEAGYPVGNFDEPEKLLRAAAHNEYEEADSVYPSFAETARSEGFASIAFSFEEIAKVEKIHGNRFSCFAELTEQSKLFSGSEDTVWMCLNCGHAVKGTVPERCPVCSEGKGYFVPYKYYCFVAEKYGLSAEL